MTVLEKYIIDHPTALSSIENGLLPIGCPSNYGYAFDPAWCDFETRDCRRCWNREIPGTEKENEKMSDELIEKAYNEKYGSTSASSHMYDTKTKDMTCDLDYKAEYGSLTLKSPLKVDVKHGRWVVENEESIRCSECCFNRASIKIPLDYCPNCGARMDGECLEANKELNAEVEKARRQRELDLFAIKDMSSTIEKYEFGFRVIEAFLGRDILEED